MDSIPPCFIGKELVACKSARLPNSDIVRTHDFVLWGIGISWNGRTRLQAGDLHLAQVLEILACADREEDPLVLLAKHSIGDPMVPYCMPFVRRNQNDCHIVVRLRVSI